MIDLVSRHPLEDALPVTPVSAGANHLAVVRSRAVWSVLAHRGHEAAVRQALSTFEGITPRFCGPQEWLVVAPEEAVEAVSLALGALSGASVVEQGGGRVVFSLSGPQSRALLAKLAAIDLHPSVFAIGQSANAMLGHAGGNIARLGKDHYEIVVMRSFAASVFGELRLLGREFGLTAAFAS